MSSDFHDRIQSRLDELQGNRVFHNFMAQAHSRNILQSLNVPEDEWPAYSDSLSKSLSNTAYYLLYQGLVLKEKALSEAGSKEDSETSNNNANDILTQGAEILEFLFEHSSTDDRERVTALMNAALGYYVAGHSARAYVLMKRSEMAGNDRPELQLLRHMFLRNLVELRRETLGILLDPDYRDDTLTNLLQEEAITDDELASRALLGGLSKALSLFLEYAKTGEEQFMTSALEMLDAAVELSKDSRYVQWWWVLWCGRYLLKEYHQRSLWRNLSRWSDDDLVQRYVESNYSLPVPVIDFWPSQLEALKALNEASEQSYCVKMPTSAGKTKVAELAILRFLLDQDAGAKCVYVAPFRSLAVEVERTLRDTLHRVGVRVSELYGGFDLSPAERLIIDEARVLVATPEKFDALLRFVPELADQVRLVIIDEGHIITPPNFKRVRKSRGLKYEVFLQRLVNRFSKSNVPIWFISAVLPNTEQFAEWITGSSENIIVSDWRPSRLMLGTATWTGRQVNLQFTHAGTSKLEHPCFVNRFVTQVPGSSVPTRRVKPFPADIREALALTGLNFAQKGMTLIFEARKASVESLGEVILKAIQLRRAIARSQGEDYGLPLDDRASNEIAECVRLAKETMGIDSPVAQFLEEGFIVHHGDLPHPLRLAIERLVRAGHVRLVVATTTLAQGVNLPVRTVLVHGLQHDQDESVNPMTFWNICGRAGRGMKENEGQVLFMVQGSADEWMAASHRRWLRGESPRVQQRKWTEWSKKQMRSRDGYVSSYGNYSVTSALLTVIEKIKELWKIGNNPRNYTALCEALASNLLQGFRTDPNVDVDGLINTLDGLLIALTEEHDVEDITVEETRKLLGRSLLFLQCQEKEWLGATKVIQARIQYIRKQHPDQANRRKLYQLGLPLNDCITIMENRQYLLDLYRSAGDFDEWDVDTRVEHIAEISHFLLQLQEIMPEDNPPDSWPKVLERWLSGESPDEMIADDDISADFGGSPKAVSRFIDDVFEYRLPWGLNSLQVYLSSEAAEHGDPLPAVTSYYASMVKLGVFDDLACLLLTLGVLSRKLALRLAAAVPDQYRVDDSVSKWFRNVTAGDLRGYGLNDEEIAMVLEHIRQLKAATDNTSRSRIFERHLRSVHGHLVQPGDRLLIKPNPDRSDVSYSLYTTVGDYLGTYKTSLGELPSLWNRPDLLDVAVSYVLPEDETFVIGMSIRVI